MSEPTQLVISEQAREAAIKEIDWPITVYPHGHHIQLLLNSQREAIIRDCAEMASKHYKAGHGKRGLNNMAVAKIRHAILAKLQNK